MVDTTSCIILGVGNSLHSDDGCGPYIAEILAKRGMKAYNCGTTPENFTGLVRKNLPHLLLIIDAVMMNEAPGTIRLIPEGKIPDTAIGTHMLPLSHLVKYLSGFADQIQLIGIQPESLANEEGLSPSVEVAVLELKELILNNLVENLPVL